VFHNCTVRWLQNTTIVAGFFFFVDILLTVHLNIILVINQLDAQNLVLE